MTTRHPRRVSPATSENRWGAVQEPGLDRPACRRAGSQSKQPDTMLRGKVAAHESRRHRSRQLSCRPRVPRLARRGHSKSEAFPQALPRLSVDGRTNQHHGPTDQPQAGHDSNRDNLRRIDFVSNQPRKQHRHHDPGSEEKESDLGGHGHLRLGGLQRRRRRAVEISGLRQIPGLLEFGQCALGVLA